VRKGAFLVAGLLLPPCVFAAPAVPTPNKDVVVRCDAGQTIGGALSKLDKTRPNVLKVSGTCQENVAISGFLDLTIVGAAGATLVPVPPTTAYAIEVSASGAVSIQGLTIRQPEDRTGMGLGACADCRLKNVTVDGGIGFYAYAWSQVTLSGFKSTGTGGWTSVGAWQANLFIEDSVFEDTSGGQTSTRWCGLCVGQSSVVNVFRSTFRHFGVGIGADSSAFMYLGDATTVEDNWCYGVQASTGAHLVLQQGSRVMNNAPICWGGGITVDSTATLSIDQSQVTGNTGGGVKLNHHAFAQLGGGTAITSNLGPGLEVRNVSMAVAPGPMNPPQTVEISANQWGGDLSCDSISHINNGAQITGTTQNQCLNLHPGDGP
jgi:hypothetical protein